MNCLLKKKLKDKEYITTFPVLFLIEIAACIALLGLFAISLNLLLYNTGLLGGENAIVEKANEFCGTKLGRIIFVLSCTEDGDLRPLNSIVVLIGIGELTLNSWNAFALQRVKGILVWSIVRVYSPCNMFFLFGRIVFFVMAQLACETGALTSAIAAFFAQCICLMHTSALFLVILPSVSGKKISIHKYVEKMLKRNCWNASEHTEKRAKACVLDYATYLGSLWVRTSYQPSAYEEDGEEWYLLMIAMAWIDKKDVKSVSSEDGDNSDNNLKLLPAFSMLFPDSSSGIHALLTEGLPYDVEIHRKDYQKKALQCRLVWENFLAPVKEQRRREQMIHYLLSCAYKCGSICFAMMASGLLLYSGLLQGKRRNVLEHMEASILELWRLNQVEEENRPLLDTTSMRHFSAGWVEMMYIAVSGLAWNYAAGYISEENMDAVRRMLGSITASTLDKTTQAKALQSMSIYHSYGFFLFCVTNMDIYDELSAYKIIMWNQIVEKETEYLY